MIALPSVYQDWKDATVGVEEHALESSASHARPTAGHVSLMHISGRVSDLEGSKECVEDDISEPLTGCVSVLDVRSDGVQNDISLRVLRSVSDGDIGTEAEKEIDAVTLNSSVAALFDVGLALRGAEFEGRSVEDCTFVDGDSRRLEDCTFVNEGDSRLAEITLLLVENNRFVVFDTYSV